MSDGTQNPNIRHFTDEDIRRLRELVNEGCVVLREVDDLKSSLSDTVKSIAQEMDIPVAQLNKVIKIAHKANLHEERAKFEQIEDILQAIKRG